MTREGRPKKNLKFKPESLRGLVPRTFGKPLQWKAEDDYSDTLPDDAKLFLAQFNDAEYRHRFTSPVGELYSPADKRKVYVQNNATRRDIISRAQVFGKTTGLTTEGAPEPVHYSVEIQAEEYNSSSPIPDPHPTPERALQLKQDREKPKAPARRRRVKKA